MKTTKEHVTEWALFEKPLDEEYTEVTLLRVQSWHINPDFCSPVVIDIHNKELTTVTPTIQHRFGNLQRIIDFNTYSDIVGQIVEGMESEQMFSHDVSVRGYRHT